MSYIGTNKIGKMYLGSTAIGKAYLGSDLVYDSAGGVTPVLPYDAQVEYLQSSGTQYIDTGIKPTTNFKCEIKAKYLQNNNGFDTMVGCYDGTRYGVALGLQSKIGGGKLYIQFGSGANSYALSDATTTTSLHTFITQLSNNTLSISVDGTANTATYSGELPNMNLFLFARNNATVGNFSNAKIYYCKIWNGGSLVFDAIPVRVGQTGYLYDKISRQLFGNSGNGDFAIGNDIIGNGLYLKKSYISSSSPSTITTGVASVGSKWEIDAQYTGANPRGNLVVICSDDLGAHFFGVTSNGKWGSNNTFELPVTAATRSVILVEFIQKGIVMTIGNNTLTRERTDSIAHAQYINLLCYGNKYKYTGRIYGIKCVSGGSFEAVPAQRISDGVFGLYDVENDVFYSGNYTGE